MAEGELYIPKDTKVVLAPVPDAAEHTVSAEIWEALTDEINFVVGRIDAGEDLTPEDVVTVRNLKKQVESYLTTFNKAMRDAQNKYKDLVAKQLSDLGYDRIEAYIQMKRQEQTKEQNARLMAKQTQLRDIVFAQLEQTEVLKTTAIAQELLPAFSHRFPIVNSAAKSKIITNWGPYEAIIKTSLNMLETFFKDPAFVDAKLLPITSATIQQLLLYIRDGNLEHLSIMRAVFAKDAAFIATQKLKTEITTKEIAVDRIGDIMIKEISAEEKIRDIAQIIRIAETL